MNPRFHQVAHVSRWLAIASFTAVVSLSAIPSVQAQFADPQPSSPGSDSVVTNTGRYVPPDRSAPRSGSTTPGTTRGNGCSSASTTGLVPLAPQAHIGLTQAEQPTIAWFTPETEDYTMEFRIAEHLPEGGFNVVYETEFAAAEKTQPSGITVVDLEGTEIVLSSNKTYRWQAVLVCDPNRPSESLVAEADIQMVPASEALNAALSTLSEPSERAGLYASQSLWYDAIAEVLTGSSEAAESARLSLLNDLATLEEEATEENPASGIAPYDERLRVVIAQIQ